MQLHLVFSPKVKFVTHGIFVIYIKKMNKGIISNLSDEDNFNSKHSLIVGETRNNIL